MHLHYLSRMKQLTNAVGVTSIAFYSQKKVREFLKEAITQHPLPEGVTATYDGSVLHIFGLGLSRHISLEARVNGFDNTASLLEKIGSENYTSDPLWPSAWSCDTPEDYIYKIKEHISSHSNINSIVNDLSSKVLDDIEDKIINEDLAFVSTSTPKHGSNVNFIPYINRMHVKCAIRSTHEMISPHGKILCVKYTGYANEMCQPNQDILIEIGKVDYNIKSHRRTPLLADNKGNIYTLAMYHNSPIQAKFYEPVTSKHTFNYVTPDGTTISKKITLPPAYFEVNDSDFISNFSTAKSGRTLLLANVTDQVRPLIRPKSTPHRYLESVS